MFDLPTEFRFSIYQSAIGNWQSAIEIGYAKKKSCSETRDIARPRL